MRKVKVYLAMLLASAFVMQSTVVFAEPAENEMLESNEGFIEDGNGTVGEEGQKGGETNDGSEAEKEPEDHEGDKAPGEEENHEDPAGDNESEDDEDKDHEDPEKEDKESEESENPEDENEEAAFECYVTLSDGSKLKAFNKSETEQYLFLPNTVDITGLVVSLQGGIDEVSAGEYDKDTKGLTGAFAAPGDSVQITSGDKVYTVTVKQSELPSLRITLNGVDLDTIHADKEIKYKGNSVELTDINDPGNNISVGKVEMKGRGNTSWTLFEKKGYQIKFDKKQSVLGMDSAKKWILLANSSDDSMVRNAVGFSLAKELGMDETPDYRYVDLWIDNDYRGTYMICEKIEAGNGRVELSDPNGIVLERETFSIGEEEYRFYNSFNDAYFTVKDSVSEDDGTIRAAYGIFEDKINELSAYLGSAAKENCSVERLSEFIDLDDMAVQYLVNEFMKNYECDATSFYWYMDGAGDTIHAGPVWDFDTCAGNSTSALYGNEYRFYRTAFIKELFYFPAFRNYAADKYEACRGAFINTVSTAASVSALIRTSADMNYTRWNYLGSESPKTGNVYESTYPQAINKLEGFLSNRYNTFAVPQPVDNYVSHVVENGIVTVNFKYSSNAPVLYAATWGEKGGQADLAYWPAFKEGGSYVCVFPASAIGYDFGGAYISFHDFQKELGADHVRLTREEKRISADWTGQNGYVTKNGGSAFLVNGRLDTSVNGLVNCGEFLYFTRGCQNFYSRGIVKYDGESFLVSDGRLLRHSGLFQNAGAGITNADGKWYFLSGGQVQRQYTGLAKYNGAWFMIQNGVLATNIRGLQPYDGSVFLVSDGRVRKDYSGWFLNNDKTYMRPDGKKYFIAAGQVQTGYTGWVNYAGERHYITKGVVTR